MQKLSLSIIVGALLVGLSGCANNPVSSTSTNNPSVPVDLLLEHDGCKVYRFSDDGRLHYWVKCSDKDSISDYQPEGKASYPDSIDTNYSKQPHNRK